MLNKVAEIVAIAVNQRKEMDEKYKSINGQALPTEKLTSNKIKV